MTTKNYVAKYDNLYYLTNDPVFYESINHGNSEPYPKHLAIVQKYLKMFPHKNRTYIDVGTHIGSTIIPYSRLFQNVIGYEPQPENYRFATHNIRLNTITNATIYPYGLFHKESRGIMQMHVGNNSGCYYFSPFVLDGDGGFIKDKLVECKRLDDVFPITTNDVDFMKIDVHGSELRVLQGAKETILRCKPLIQIETNSHAKDLFNIENQETIQFILDLGYRYFDNSDGVNPFFYFPNITLSISPKTIYTFWNGNFEMSENRISNLNDLKTTTQCNIVFIKEIELSQYILVSEPLHPAFQYLSATHKTDYLRTYFMHFYGGGYCDIKKTGGSWLHAFDEIANLDSSDIFCCGYPEIGENGVAHGSLRTEWQKLIGNCSYIFKPNTEFTKEWYSTMLQLLDEKMDILREYFVTCGGNIHPQANYEYDSQDGYPIGWSEMLGNIFHPLVFKYHTKILRILPSPDFTNYR